MGTTSKPKTNRVLFGVIALTFSNILVKVIGLVLKIPLHSMLGGEGMSYYEVAYEIYVWLYTISTAGLPVAVAMMIAEDRAKGNLKEAKKIPRVVVLLFIVIGLVGMSVMIFGSRLFAQAYKIDNSYLCIMAIAPTLFFVCIASALRGYFQGYQNMYPTAVSEVIEAAGKLVVGVLLANYAIRQGYPSYKIAAYAILGLTIGVAAGMFFLVICKFFFNEGRYNELIVEQDLPVRSDKQLIKELVVIAIPIMLSSSVMSLTNVFDGMITSRQLQSIGYTAESAREIFGNYKTLAVSMFNLPPALIYPISYSITPLLSGVVASGSKEKATQIMNGSLRIAALISIPCALGMSVLSEPILELFFNQAASEMVAPLLSVLSISVFFVGMLAITNSILQAHRFERKPIISMIAGSAVKLISSTVLIGTPSIGMYGAPIGNCLCYLTIMLFNFGFIAKHIRFTPSLKTVLIKPFVASLFCALAAIGSFKLFSVFISGKITVLLAIATAAVVYLFMIFIIKAVTKDDIMLLPKGNKIYGILQKAHLMK